MSTVQLLSYIPGGELKFEALLKQQFTPSLHFTTVPTYFLLCPLYFLFPRCSSCSSSFRHCVESNQDQ